MANPPIDDITHLEDLAGTLRQRLQVLDLQLAFYGPAAAPVHLVTDQADTADQLAATQERLHNLRLLPGGGRTPYIGLQTFDEASADLFFGRATLVAELVERARRAALLAVLGASGSGKSSVVRAGLIPLLKGGVLPGSETWRYSIIKPGDRPLDTLAAELTKLQGGDLATMLDLSRRLAENERALLLTADLLLDRAHGQRLVLVVDQCEELWTLAPTDPGKREIWIAQQQQPFIQLLLTTIASATSPLLVVLTMRADFLHRAAEHPALASAIGDHLLIVSPMAPADLHVAITQPAHLRGARFESGLVDKLVDQVQGRSGALPLLEYTLLELWKRRDGALLTWAAFGHIGGVEGALAARADQIVADHYTAAQREMLRQTLLRLVQPGEGTADTRRRVLLTDLSSNMVSIADVQALLKPLTDERLVTTGRDEQAGIETVEMTHEALIRAWPTLGQWIAEARVDLRLRLQLEEAAKEWAASDENSDLLWSGLRLATADAWQTRTLPQLNDHERRFLDASNAAQQARHAAEEQARRERIALLEARAEAERQRAEDQHTHAAEQQVAIQQLRRRAYSLAGVLVAALVAVVVAVISFNQAQAQAGIARTQASIADQQRQEAERQAQAADQQRREAERQTQLTQQQSRIATARELAAAAVSTVNVDPQRSILLATAAIAATRTFSESVVPEAQQALQQAVQASRIQHIFTGHTAGIQSVAYRADGQQIATVGNDGTIRIWDVASGKQLSALTGSSDQIVDVAWSPDGARVVTASSDGVAQIWDVATRASVLTLPHESTVNAVAYSPDGGQIATTTVSGTLTIWDADTGGVVQTRAYDGDGGLTGVAWNPRDDGMHVAAGSDDGSITVWDTSTGRVTHMILGVDGPIDGIAWSPDGTQIAAASDNLAAMVWDVTSGELVHTLKGHASTVYSVAWSPDGRMLASASADGSAKVWNLTTEREILTLYGHSEAVEDVAFSPNGSALLTGSLDRTARVWSLALAPPDGTHVVAYDPHGDQLATAGADGAYVWDARTGGVQRFISDTAGLSGVAFSPDGKRLAAAKYDGLGWEYDLQRKEVSGELNGHTAAIGRIAWSPDGTRIATASDDTTVRVWDAQSGASQLTLAGHTRQVFGVAWSPDGIRLASAGYDGRAILWDAGSGAQLRVLTDTHTAEFNDIAFSPDGKLLALADENGTITLLDPGTGVPVHTLHAERAVNALAWSRDSTRIATAGRDTRVRVWDVATGVQLFALPHPVEVYSVAWSTDGTHIATAAADGVARIFPIDLDALLTLAEERTVRAPTVEECGQYKLDALCVPRP